MTEGFRRSTEWVYYRRWRRIEVIDDERSLEAKDKLRLWGYLSRWSRFPSLGAPPTHWLKYGHSSTGTALMSVCMQAHLAAPMAAQLNEPSTLLQFMEREQDAR